MSLKLKSVDNFANNYHHETAPVDYLHYGKCFFLYYKFSGIICFNTHMWNCVMLTFDEIRKIICRHKLENCNKIYMFIGCFLHTVWKVYMLCKNKIAHTLKMVNEKTMLLSACLAWRTTWFEINKRTQSSNDTMHTCLNVNVQGCKAVLLNPLYITVVCCDINKC